MSGFRQRSMELGACWSRVESWPEHAYQTFTHTVKQNKLENNTTTTSTCAGGRRAAKRAGGGSGGMERSLVPSGHAGRAGRCRIDKRNKSTTTWHPRPRLPVTDSLRPSSRHRETFRTLPLTSTRMNRTAPGGGVHRAGLSSYVALRPCSSWAEV